MKTLNFLKLLQGEVTYTTGAITVVAEDGTEVAASTYHEPSYTGYCQFFSPGITRTSIGHDRSYAFHPSLSLISNGTQTFMSGGNPSTNYPKLGVILGDGNTAPAQSDYWLSGSLLTSFTASTAVTCTVANGKVVTVGTYNITNTSGSAFTIREIGFTRASDSSNTKYILLMRDVLDTPIVVAGNGTAVVEYKVVVG